MGGFLTRPVIHHRALLANDESPTDVTGSKSSKDRIAFKTDASARNRRTNPREYRFALRIRIGLEHAPHETLVGKRFIAFARG